MVCTIGTCLLVGLRRHANAACAHARAASAASVIRLLDVRYINRSPMQHDATTMRYVYQVHACRESCSTRDERSTELLNCHLHLHTSRRVQAFKCSESCPGA